MGRNLERQIARWYRGVVCSLIDLRPDTVIKDDAVPDLLRRQDRPTFVTINERDFWRRISADDRYGVVCCTLADSRVPELPELLRGVLRRQEFRTRAGRMGKVIRVTDREISYYSVSERTPRALR